jgi:hypothetical protein
MVSRSYSTSSSVACSKYTDATRRRGLPDDPPSIRASFDSSSSLSCYPVRLDKPHLREPTTPRSVTGVSHPLDVPIAEPFPRSLRRASPHAVFASVTVLPERHVTLRSSDGSRSLISSR